MIRIFAVTDNGDLLRIGGCNMWLEIPTDTYKISTQVIRELHGDRLQISTPRYQKYFFPCVRPIRFLKMPLYTFCYELRKIFHSKKKVIIKKKKKEVEGYKIIFLIHVNIYILQLLTKVYNYCVLHPIH